MVTLYYAGNNVIKQNENIIDAKLTDEAKPFIYTTAV